MGKTKQADAFSPLRGQFKEMKKENKQLKDKLKECEKKIKELDKQNKEYVKESEKENKELQKRLKTLEDQKNADNFNGELSEYAKLAIKVSRGPLMAEELKNFLVNDVFDKRNKNVPLLTSIRKYSNNIDGVKEQLLDLPNNMQPYMEHREDQKKLDDKLIKTITKLHETIGKEQEKLMYNGKSPLNRNSEDINNGRTLRKRKFIADDESSSSQDNTVMHVTSDFKKRVKINSSSEDPIESRPKTEFEESDKINGQHTINQREFTD